MTSLDENLISVSTSGRAALIQLDKAKVEYKTLFIVDEQGHLLGTLTDGDIRRGLIKGLDIDGSVGKFIHRDYKYLQYNTYDLAALDLFRKNRLTLVPVIDENKKLLRVIDLAKRKALLPLDAVIMAGGRGERLKPLTDTIPKPLLKVGSKPIIEHNIDRLINYGVDNITISIKYLGDQIIDAFGDGSSKGTKIGYITEDKPLGTLGAISLIPAFYNSHVLVMNSDLLTNIDFEDFFKTYLEQEADIAIATVPYKVNVPYAVMEVDGTTIKDFKEKPSYTYFSNAGIYLVKREFLELIPKGKYYDATDFIELLLKADKKVVSYPILGYWLDIGKHEDFLKAQEDIKHIQL